MTPPRITVVIPAFQAAGWVGRAIESALAQTRRPDEIIVVDDGSTDKTAEVAARFAPAVQVIRRPNGGPGAARNTGIRASSGDWIALLDADDTWAPLKLERQVPLTADPRVGLVHARETLFGNVPAPPLFTFDDLWRRNSVIASSALLRKKCLDAVGGFDERRSLIGVEDYNLWLRIAAAGWQIAASREWLVRYTPAPGNLSGRSLPFLDAELANIDVVAQQLSLPSTAVQAKRESVLVEYADQFRHRRDLSAAREAYRRLLRIRTTPAALLGLGVTMLPRFVLDAGRRWRRREARGQNTEWAPGSATP